MRLRNTKRHWNRWETLTFHCAQQYSTSELAITPHKPLTAMGYLDWKAEEDKKVGPVEQMQERAREVSDPIQEIRERNRLAEEQAKARQDRIDKMDPIDRARRGLEETKGRIIL